MLIKNSVILVTGGASNEYGRSVVERLLNEGARVIICDLPTRELDIYGDDKAIFLPINVNSEQDVKTLITVITEKYGRLDGVVNCIDHHKIVPIYDSKEKVPHGLKEFADIVYENILAPYNVIRFAIPLLAKNIPKKTGGRGVIINMSNEAAYEGKAGSCAYSASKAAIIRMTEALALELQGIQVRCISIVTSFDGDAAGQSNGLGVICDQTPRRTTGEAKKFAELVKTVIEMPATNTQTEIKLES